MLAVKAVKPEPAVEVHCHGGRRVVRWVVEQFLAGGCREDEPPAARPGARRELTRAPTLRTASILLDQYHGAFDRAVAAVFADLDAGRVAPQLGELAHLAPAGRHLVEPWKVVIAGPPNVGKSSLVNALAGYQRSVVSDIAGTTRDVVTVPVAFGGWPVELADTAGLRAAAGLEAAGVERAERFIRSADLVVWVLDATADELEYPDDAKPADRWLLVLNKIDLEPSDRADVIPDVMRLSAATGEGMSGLAAAIARRLVTHAPEPGAAAPYTPALAEAVYLAHVSAAFGQYDAAAAILRAAIGPG
ncbi:MAG: 50S ribosome-binding GTPase [Gemmataceae bacterium]|nr:50S ribosome-binding GTPase [Gemmataceae bacterium]